MCGIAGFMGQVENRADVIRNMTEVITHRGPDSDGFFTDDNISMGFRRLSIIDLGAGHQPIYNEDKSLVLTFNGEIYNYKDLRKELIAKGHKFYTDTDSEVLVHGFEEWKEDMLPKLRGMFGFAIYNTKDNSLFIARDFFGIKPMHYTQIGNDFVYASEIKSILEYPKFEKKFNRKALDSYLSFQYAVPPETFFEGVYCLMPGHYLWYKDGEVETTRYFEARFNPNEEMTEEEAVDRIEKVFENSVNAHKIADVEVGCFLSSGVTQAMFQHILPIRKHLQSALTLAKNITKSAGQKISAKKSVLNTTPTLSQVKNSGTLFRLFSTIWTSRLRIRHVSHFTLYPVLQAIM